MLDTLANTGIIFTKDVIDEFRSFLQDNGVDENKQSRLCQPFRKYMDTMIVLHGRLERQYNYDKHKFSTHSVNYIIRCTMEKGKQQYQPR